MKNLDIKEMKSVSGGICRFDPNNPSGCLPPEPSDCDASGFTCIQSLPLDKSFPNMLK